ncbi:MAG TPA: ABC transporter permease [Streptosporangiaceae bacterium]|nr:ABC transporter permease [Streptosporangiaceae bacterium]
MSVQPEEVALGLKTQHDLVTVEPLAPSTFRRSRRRKVGRWYEFRFGARVGLAVTAILVLAGIAAPLIAPDNPLHLFPQIAQGTSLHHLLGTDLDGRDVLSRLIYGSTSAYEGVGIALLVTAIVGIPWGLIAGFGGKVADEGLMRIADMFFSFPALILSIGIISVLGPSLVHSMVAVGVAFAPSIARLLRASTLPLRRADFVLVASSLGVKRFRIVLRHVLPNAIAPVLVQMFALASITLVIEAALGFLALGAQPPAPSWGNDLATAYTYFLSNPTATIAPGVCIAIAAWGLSALGDGLREVFIFG